MEESGKSGWTRLMGFSASIESVIEVNWSEWNKRQNQVTGLNTFKKNILLGFHDTLGEGTL